MNEQQLPVAANLPAGYLSSQDGVNKVKTLSCSQKKLDFRFGFKMVHGALGINRCFTLEIHRNLYKLNCIKAMNIEI